MKTFTLIFTLLAVMGCSKPPAQTQRNVSGNLLSYTAFDLETVVGVVKQNKFNGAEELEAFVNDNNGVNNVDLDKDGNIDYISVKESREGETIVLDFVASPTTGDTVTVANLKFTQNTSSQELEVQGGYPSYVQGGHSHYYSYRRPGLSFGEAMFLAWMFTPSRSHYYRPVPMFTPRPVLGSSTLVNTRTTTRTTTKVGPVKNSSKPNSYKVKSAEKTQSKLKAKQATSRAKQLEKI